MLCHRAHCIRPSERRAVAKSPESTKPELLFRELGPAQRTVSVQMMSSFASVVLTDAMPACADACVVYIWLMPTIWPFWAVSVK